MKEEPLLSDLSLNKQIKLEHRHQPPVSKSRLEKAETEIDRKELLFISS